MGAEDDVVALTARLVELEGRVAELERASVPLATPLDGTRIPMPPPPGAQIPRLQPPPPGPQQVGSPPPIRRPMPSVTAEDLLKWAGVILVVLAAVFFVATAINRGWIGPELQLAGATLIGLALVAGGFWLKETNRSWSIALTVGGAAVLPVCAAASNAALDLVTEYPALIGVGVVTIALGRVAMKLSMEAVAAVAGIVAVFLPFWIFDDVEEPILTVGGWLAGLVLAITWLGWHRSWVLARLATVLLAGVALLGLAGSDEVTALSSGEQLIGLVVTAIVAAAAWVGPAFAPTMGLELAGWKRSIDYRSAFMVPVWSWIMVGAIVQFEGSNPYSLVGLAMAAGSMLIAAAAWRLPKPLVAAHLLAAGILASVALANLTTSPALLVALATQAVATAILAWMLRDALLGVFGAILAAIALAWAGISTLSGWFEQLDAGQDLANLFVVVLLVAAAAYGWWRRSDSIATVLTVLAWLAVLGWLPSVLVHLDQGQAAISILWAMAAAAALVHGLWYGFSVSRVLGLITLGVTLVKLLTIDLSAVDTLWRVGLFLIVGSGLLRLGYILPRLSTGRESQLR
ncbi:MAG: DUF2339 domain-containing protein [Actinomycetia bacterium]|nr:DUF2339 domain-containing protein [Actinomycetes bacterium]